VLGGKDFVFLGIERKKPVIFDFEWLVLILRIRTENVGCDFGGIRQGTRDNRGGFEGV
jgi:hypothetical protein